MINTDKLQSITTQLYADIGGDYFPSFALKNIAKMIPYALTSSCGKVSMVTFYSKKKDLSFINKAFEYCIKTYNYLLERFCNGNYKSLVIVLILNKDKRILPSEKCVELTPVHINGGFTTFAHNTEYNICVYRKEDCIKVLVHEIIHFFEVDGHGKYTSSKVEESFTKKHNIISNVRYFGWFEAVTETYAVYLLCQFGYFNKLKITKSMLQVAETYVNHFYNRIIKDTPPIFKESTHSYMYIIGRVSLWCLECKDASKVFIDKIEEQKIDAESILGLITKADMVNTILGNWKQRKGSKKYSNSLKIDYNND